MGAQPAAKTSKAAAQRTSRIAAALQRPAGAENPISRLALAPKSSFPPPRLFFNGLAAQQKRCVTPLRTFCATNISPSTIVIFGLRKYRLRYFLTPMAKFRG